MPRFLFCTLPYGLQFEYVLVPTKVKQSLYTIALVTLLFSCSTARLTDEQRLLKSVRNELPFRVDSLNRIGESIYGFRSSLYISTPPDYTIGEDGELMVFRTTVLEPTTEQRANQMWRNLVVSKRHHRVVCIDRIRNEAGTDGRLYVMQMESKNYPALAGVYHWDVSDVRNLQAVGNILDDFMQQSLRWMRGEEEAVRPRSQEEYWRLMFHADSLFDAKRYDEAISTYNLAFNVDKYILPSQLSTVAKKMASISRRDEAMRYLNHRLELEHDFYEPIYDQLPDAFRDIMLQRADSFHYDLPLKCRLEEVFERDQYYRLLWLYSSMSTPADSVRNKLLAERALRVDSLNLVDVSKILDEHGFPRKEEVGEMAMQAVWIVFQHADLEHQRRFLPVMEQAVAEGRMEASFLATLKDRIDVREGRPQRYGTQNNPDGRPCQLLDPSRVNQWRKEVGLPPLKI